MANEDQEVSVVARAAPESKERTVQLCRSTIPICTEHDCDTTCDLFSVMRDSLEEVFGLGIDFFARCGEGDRRWDVGFAVVARIAPIHRTSQDSKTASAIQQLRETRLWGQIGYWRSRDPADGPAGDVVKDMEEAAEESSRNLVKEIRDQGRSPFPDNEFAKKMAILLREEDAPGRPLPELPGFGEFCTKVLRLAAADPKAAVRELDNAQKSRDGNRKRMPRQLMTVMQDEILRAYCQGMELLLPELQKEGYCEDRYSLRFFRFFHHQQPYLDGLVPDLHPIRKLLLKSKRFIDAAVRRFCGDAPQALSDSVRADFFGALEAAAQIGQAYRLRARTVDRERKRRRRTVFRTGSDLENLVYDKGMKLAGPPVAKKSRKAKKASGTKKLKTAKKRKKTKKSKRK